MSGAGPLIVWLDDVRAGPALLGGKFGSLANLVEAGFAVPPGFGVTTAGYRRFVEHEDLLGRITATRAEAGPDDLEALERAGAAIAQLIETAAMPEPLEAEIRSAYAALGERSGVQGPPVAVRSSGTLEDTAGASFAGQYDTFLWIQGADSVLDHVRRCWAGLFGPAVLTYDPQGQGGATAGRSSMCVGIQQMVPARAAGVAFTLDPVTGDRSKLVIEAVWGLGEGVVSGDITPDRFRLDKITLEILAREISDKEVEHRFDPESRAVRLMPVEEERRGLPCLADEQLVALATEAKKIERHRGAPQDIEWAVDDEGRVHVLQVRPETVWSLRPPKRIAKPGETGVKRVLGSFVPKPGEPA
jgi:pyruvate, water dikinase